MTFKITDWANNRKSVQDEPEIEAVDRPTINQNLELSQKRTPKKNKV